MIKHIELGNLEIEVTLKNIKHVYLSVYPPTGKVRIAAPARMKLDTIRVFAISKLDWIKRQQKKFQEQERESPRDYLDRESHYLWGQRYLLKVIEKNAPPQVILKHKTLCLQIRPGTPKGKIEAIMAKWYREQLKQKIPILLAKWEPIINMKVNHVYVRRMKTKWGSCNPRTRSIRLNTELAKKPLECLEYVLVHEMVHFFEQTHNHYFITLMDQYMPKWEFYRDILNALPAKHEHWKV